MKKKEIRGITTYVRLIDGTVQRVENAEKRKQAAEANKQIQKNFDEIARR